MYKPVRPALSKSEHDEICRGIRKFFICTVIFCAAINIVGSIYKANNPKVEGRNIVDTCAEAKLFLNLSLDARDAITVNEAMTAEGRAKWEILRDKAIEAELLQDRLCGLSIPSS